MKLIVCPVCGTKKKVESKVKTCSIACGQKYRVLQQTGTTQQQSTPVASDETMGERRTLARVVENPIKNEKELAAVCEIDLDEWRIERWTCNAWTGFAKVGVKGSEEIQQVQQYQVKAWLERDRQKSACLEIIDRMAERYRPPKFNIVRRLSKSGVGLEIGPYDHHFAGLAWAPETKWANWDLDISTEFWHASMEKLLSRVISPKIERTFMVFGNDIAHVDSPKNETFAGTRQDMDTRWEKMIDHLIGVAKGTVDGIAADVSPVELLMVDGNHDPTTVRWIGRLLEEHYRNHKHVTVRREPTKRKIIEWGRNLVMLSHAERATSRSKFRGLANILAAEHPEEWGRTEWREVHTGHLHHDLSEDVYGVIVRRLPSLCPPNAWASEEGYVGSQRGAIAFEWDREEGLIGQPRYNVPRKANSPLEKAA